MSRRAFSLSGRSLSFTALALVVACSGGGLEHRPERSADPSPVLRTSVAHRDARLGVPTFLWVEGKGSAFASAQEAASATLTSARAPLGLTASALASVSAPSIDDHGEGPILAHFRQRVAGVEVFRAGLRVVMSRAFEPIAASGSLAPSLEGAAAPFEVPVTDVLSRAHRIVFGQPAAFAQADVAGDYTRWTSPALTHPARTKKVFYPRNGALEPAYYVEIVTRGPSRSFVVSARTGDVLFQNDLVRHEAFNYRVYADPTTRLPYDGPQGNVYAPHPTGRPDGKKITYVPSQLVTLQNFPFSKNDPWLLPGATSTKGNNVDAYADLEGPDGYSDNTKDVRAAISAPSTFDYVYDTTKSPGAAPASVRAAVTHLFYMTNFMHDWFYDAGFDESSGNHQFLNFGRGGSEGDALVAEAQDYEGRNNANATTPADGDSPRLQMYVFSGPSNANLTVAPPASIAGVKAVGIGSEFGKDIFLTSGAVALGVDGQGVDVNDACEELSNDVRGKIVLVHRGTCSFVQKAKVVQAAGGAGVLIANVPSSAAAETAPFMGGSAPDVLIPALSLSLSDGKALETAVRAGEAVNVTMKREVETDLDGAMDNSIVAHEWGHVLSNRLVADGNGLTTNQAGGLGEGWGDFTSLLVTVRADDLAAATGANWTGAYATGTYAMSGSGADAYFGIRRVPYSVDFARNALTLKHIQNGVPLPTTAPISFGEDGGSNAEVHNTGEIWATMLWECYVALLRDPRYDFTAAQDRMKRYLVASLKLTPPDPTILEARDAVLASAYAVDRKDFEAFWGAFARRGAGVGARGPAKDSADNSGVVESFAYGNEVDVLEAKISDDVISCDKDGFLDEGEVGTVDVVIRNGGVGALTQTTARIASRTGGVSFAEGREAAFGALDPFKTATAKVKASIRNREISGPVEFDVEIDDPTLATPRTIKVTLPTKYHVDEAADSATVDHVDTKRSAWIAAGTDGNGFSTPWKRTLAKDGYWTVPNSFDTADLTLTSPPFTVEGASFGLSFRHRHSFRFSARRQVDLDGGVVEISVDNGKTWKDAENYAKVDYNTTLDEGRGDNPIRGRRAYGNKSAGYPDAWITSRYDVTLREPPESVRVRFRVGSSLGFAGAPGWDVDDIELTGVTSKPFWGLVPNAENCDPNAPVANAGLPRTVASRSSVSLDGSATSPMGSAKLAYLWTQTAGPEVGTKGNEQASLFFVAPDVAAPTVLSFALRANDGTLLGPAARVDVTVLPGGPSDDGGCAASPKRGAAGGATFAVAALLVALARRRRRDVRP